MTESIWTDAVWRRSSRSNGGGQCVEIAVAADLVAVRDSKNPDGARLVFPVDAWQSFLGWIADGSDPSTFPR